MGHEPGERWTSPSGDASIVVLQVEAESVTYRWTRVNGRKPRGMTIVSVAPASFDPWLAEAGLEPDTLVTDLSTICKMKLTGG
jgi:hypothetical protein